ncbi:serine/threonine protein kinase [Streptomyces sp. BR123]|uniref:serine/threonine-protein kinase n=1 Tax=Streptomyces sp. BR123 TaxID=2749828 RepID=UPI0015C42483|nr:serine/threonine-protein kinase [Streptomyces sp. BR123]NXY92900.1 serine/threonine protein kinase [Streptomyces sp. BR123]
MGEVFAGRYELIDPIGRGGAGAVWRAWDQRRRRYVAAKVLQQGDAHTLLRFVREQALRIDHPHVLAPASWAADDDKVLFTMDLVSGGSLAHVIGDYGPLPPRFVCTLLDQLLSGLAAVHAEGVIHRDIKPANILMEATGTGRPHLRLSDFGISMRKGEPRLTETHYVVGTPGYFAPEQLQGAEPDFPADLFAVGLVALYLLTGRKPDSAALVEQFLAHGVPDAPEGVPTPLWDVIANLLQPDPQNRFKTATGVRRALTEAVELLPSAPPGDDPVEVFDQLGPLPPGFGPQGPQKAAGPAPSEPSAPGAPTASAVPAQPAPPAAEPSQTAAVTAATVAAEPTRTDPRGTPTPATAVQAGPFPQPGPAPAAPAAPAAAAASVTGSFHLAPPEPVTAPHPAAPAPAPAARTGGIAPPPRKAAAALLAAALLCFAVGAWALTQL